MIIDQCVSVFYQFHMMCTPYLFPWDNNAGFHNTDYTERDKVYMLGKIIFHETIKDNKNSSNLEE